MTPVKRVWSLWDMLRIRSEDFVLSMEYIGRIASLFCADESNDPAIESTIASIKESCETLEPFLGQFRVPATMAAIAQTKEVCAKEKVSEKEIGRAAEQIFERFRVELGEAHLMIVGEDYAKFLEDDAAPFGHLVQVCFPEINEDIEEGAKCLALERYTATVFHLMRVMELAIHTLAKRLRIQIDLRTASWNEIGQAVTNAINKMPGKSAAQKKKKQRYAEASANLTSVRIAWRNEVMHPKSTYTKQEAERIFMHVEGFIQSLIPLV